MPLRATGKPSSKRMVISSRLIWTSSFQKAGAHDGDDDLHAAGEQLEILGLVVAPRMLESVE